MRKYLLIGNITLDRIHVNDGCIEQQGGPSLFAYKILSSFGEEPFIVSKVGKVVPKELENIKKGLIKSHEMTQVDIYSEGSRGEYGVVTKYAGEIQFEDILKEYLDVSAIIISTVFDDVTVDTLSKIRENSKALIALDIQGFMREKKLNEKVQKHKIDLDFLKHVDIVKLNKNEFETQFPGLNVEEGMKRIKSYGPKIVILTKGKEGATSLEDKFCDFPVSTVNVKHSVGAGDAFLAAFVYFYKETKNIGVSGKKAVKKVSDYLSEEL